MPSFLLDSDLGKLLLHLKMSDKQTEWIENCRRQFCKLMKAKPDLISGGGEYIFEFLWVFWYEYYINRSCVS